MRSFLVLFAGLMATPTFAVGGDATPAKPTYAATHSDDTKKDYIANIKTEGTDDLTHTCAQSSDAFEAVANCKKATLAAPKASGKNCVEITGDKKTLIPELAGKMTTPCVDTDLAEAKKALGGSSMIMWLIIGGVGVVVVIILIVVAVMMMGGKSESAHDEGDDNMGDGDED